MTQYGIRLVINIFDLCIFWRFLEIFIGKRRTSAEISIMLILVCEVAGSIINLKEINWMNLITLAVILGIFICQYEEKISTKVVAVMMYMGLVVVAEPVGYIIYRASVIQLLTDERAVYYITVFAMELFRAILVEVFCRIKMGKVLRLGAMPREIIYMLVLIPLASLVGCFLLIEVVQEQLSARTAILCMCIIFTIILTDYMVFLMIESYTNMAEKQHEEEMVSREISYQDEYYKDMERYQEQIQDIKHDMKNRLGTLYDAAGEGDSSMMMTALEEMLDDISLAEDIIYSANPVLNSILKIKAAKAKENGIDITVHVFIPQKVSVEIGDMGVLYGNLLDNAIEACCFVKQEGRFIEFDTKYQEGNLFVLIKNSKTGKENKEMSTTKKDKRKHGRGVRAVQRVAEKYDGNLILKDWGDVFEAKLLLTGIERLE